MNDPDVTIASLAEHPDLVAVIAAWHWREWGHTASGETLDDWVVRLRSRAGLAELPASLPITYVALLDGAPVGAVSVCWDDIDQRFPGVGPWLSGMVVRSDARNLGIGARLVRAAEEHSRRLGHEQMWLYTREARRFYGRLGWQVEADAAFPHSAAVLSKRLLPGGPPAAARPVGAPLVVAHRGASTECPENTMPAFRRAIELGADVIELDVQRTSDGRLVVFHDMTLDRTTNGHGPVFAAGFDEIRGLDAGSWCSAEFAGTQVPTLDEVLGLEGIGFELELKGYGETFVDEVLAAVRRAGVLDRVEFTGADPLLVAMLRGKESAATTGRFSAPRPAWMSDEVFEHHVVGTAATSGASVAHVYAHDITPAIAQRLHELGMQVHANDAADATVIRRAIDAGADRLSANDVALAVAVVRARRTSG